MEIAEIIVSVFVGLTLCICVVLIIRSLLSKKEEEKNKTIFNLERDVENYRFLTEQIRSYFFNCDLKKHFPDSGESDDPEYEFDINKDKGE